jgi:hypothetical protein
LVSHTKALLGTRENRLRHFLAEMMFQSEAT